MFNSAVQRSRRGPAVARRQPVNRKPESGELRWIIGFVVVGAILGALTSDVDLPFTGKPAPALTASAE